MAKFLSDAALDTILDYLATCTRETLCSSQPTTYAEVTTYKLADVTIDSGDFSKANGDSSGRKSTVAAQNGLTATASGTAGHVALSISGSSTLVAVTTCASQGVTSGNAVNIGSFKLEVADVA